MFKFEPVNKEELLNIFEILNRKLQTLKCKVIILDNPIQHLFCCRKHIFKRLFCYQVACNRLLRYYFGHYTVINHRYLLQKQIKQIIIENMLTYFKIWFISSNIFMTVQFIRYLREQWAHCRDSYQGSVGGPATLSNSQNYMVIKCCSKQCSIRCQP